MLRVNENILFRSRIKWYNLTVNSIWISSQFFRFMTCLVCRIYCIYLLNSYVTAAAMQANVMNMNPQQINMANMVAMQTRPNTNMFTPGAISQTPSTVSRAQQLFTVWCQFKTVINCKQNQLSNLCGLLIFYLKALRRQLCLLIPTYKHTKIPET